MLKNNFKALFLLGMLFSRVAVAASAPSLAPDLLDITERLTQPELDLVAAHDKVVYLTPELVSALNPIEMKQDSALKDLKDLVHLGYVVAPYDETLEAVNHAICLCTEKNPNHLSLKSLFSYKEMMEQGKATLVLEEMGDRRNRTRKYCKICVRSIIARCITANSATFCNAGVAGVLNVFNINGSTCSGAPTGCPLLINSNVVVCGSLNPLGGFGVAGACNPASTPIAFNAPITTCGNVTFNTATASLNAQGAFEAKLRAIRGTVSFASSGIILDVGAGVPNSVIPVTGILPTATIVGGAGLALTVPVIGNAISSGINVSAVNPDGIEFYFAVDLRIPVTFATPNYTSIPTVLLALQNILPTVTTTTAIVDANTATVVQLVASDVTAGGATINVVFNVAARGGEGQVVEDAYATAAVNAATAINAIINRGLLVNLLSDGTVA